MTGLEGDLGLEPQAEPLLLKIPLKIIQDSDNTQEAHQCQKTSPLCRLFIWEVPQETMEEKNQMLGWVNQ